MAQKLWRLPCAHDLIASNLSVSGQFCLECFAGQAMITLGLLLTCVPCMRPWDSKYGQQFNVLTIFSILLSLIHAQRIIAAHFATPCQSMSWARSPQLRSALRPSGLPGFTGKQQHVVTLGNQLLAFTCWCCVGRLALGAFFSIKNHELSWLWLQQDMLMLADLRGVALAKFCFKNFAVPYF